MEAKRSRLGVRTVRGGGGKRSRHAQVDRACAVTAPAALAPSDAIPLGARNRRVLYLSLLPVYEPKGHTK